MYRSLFFFPYIYCSVFYIADDPVGGWTKLALVPLKRLFYESSRQRVFRIAAFNESFQKILIEALCPFSPFSRLVIISRVDGIPANFQFLSYYIVVG